MKTVEYGTEHSQVVLLLHGGGLSWWNYRETAQLLSKRYRVLLPVLDGHAGSDCPFVSIEENARSLIAWVDEHCAGQVLLLGGVSLGAQIAAEMMAQRSTICRYAVLESALAIPMKCTHALVKPAYSLCYPLIGKRWFAKLQAWSLHIPAKLFEEYYEATAQLSKTDLIAMMAANAAYQPKASLSCNAAQTLVLVGGKELPIMKRSAKLLANLLPNAQRVTLQGTSHGEYSLCRPQQYAEAVFHLIDA